ncbi:hypothetical protein [Microbacterium sp. KR10-403]|uniref:hypothetical protein n=1 Tax=Microbacterium sp. KR10-403 TaxID=3158581 RepID=UPI0032E4D26E
MPHTSFTPVDLAGAALSLPVVTLLIAAVLVAILLIATNAQSASAPALTAGAAASRHLPELRAVRGVAIGVIAVFIIDVLVRGYLLDLSDVVSWWRFATPLFVALVGVCVVLSLVTTRGTTRPESPVSPTARRTWTSFGPRAGLIGAGIVLAALVATTVTAGLASSPDGQGRYIWLVIPVPNESGIDPLRTWFYGWAYGVPVLICTAALAIATWVTLQRNAARSFVRPDTVAAERAARRVVAGGVVRIATGAMLLSLAGAWRLISSAGSGSLLWIMGQNGGQPYDAMWRYGALADLAGWLAPFAEIAGFALLLLVAARRARVMRSAPRPEFAGVEALR